MLTIAKIRKQLDGHSGAGPQTNKSYKFQTSEYIMETGGKNLGHFSLNGFDGGQTTTDNVVKYFRN